MWCVLRCGSPGVLRPCRLSLECQQKYGSCLKEGCAIEAVLTFYLAELA